MTGALPLSPAAAAFDAIAGDFDECFGGWRSVAAQRRAVRRELLRTFPAGARLLEVGGGTGLDARWLVERGREVLLTDASPAMVEEARRKLAAAAALDSIVGLRRTAASRSAGTARVCAAEGLDELAAERAAAGEALLDGAYSNFAALNCVRDLRQVGRSLARLLRPGAPALLVLFGPLPPGEVLVELLRRRPRAAVRRLRRGPVRARMAGREFEVHYPWPRAVRRALAPWFRLKRLRGIGVLVPPSAAEPWISSHPRLLGALEELDRALSAPLARLGDHLLYHFVRTDADA